MTMEPRAELTRIRRELYAKTRTEPPAEEPLATRQKHAVKRLLPISQRVARKVARQWHTPAVELESVAQEHLVDAVRRFDGRGNLDGFCGQWIRWRLLDCMKHRKTIQQIEKPLPTNQHGRRGNIDRRPGDFKRNIGGTFDELPDDMPLRLRGSYKRDPKSRSPMYGVILNESAKAIRHCLDDREVRILEYRLRNWTCTSIAPIIGLSARRTQELWADIDRSLKHHATDGGIDYEELGWAVVHANKQAAEDFSEIFRVL